MLRLIEMANLVGLVFSLSHGKIAMARTFQRIFFYSLVFSALCACSFVEVKPGAENIILAKEDDSCTRLGLTTVSVLSEIGFFDRNQETMAEELQILAQNSAFKMGGNAIWPESDIIEGERSFAVLRCEAR